MKMKNISKAIILFSLLGTVFNYGCSDELLDEFPKGFYHTGNFEDTIAVPYDILADSYVLDTYNQFRGWTGCHFFFVGATSIPSDDADKGSTASDGGVNMISLDNYTFNAYNGATQTLYDGSYQGISKANQALAFIKVMPDDMAELRDRLMGEAYFLRGYHYFRLAQGFGGVSLVDKVLGPDDEIEPRATLEDTWKFIEDDFLAAIEMLPSKGDIIGTSYLGRATKEAAQGFLAKTYVYQMKWVQTLEQTNAVIGSGVCDLSTPIDKIFTEAQENGKESLFEAQFDNTIGQPGLTGGYAEIQGVRGKLDRGWGFNNPSPTLVAAFEDGDPRLASTVIVSGEYAPDGTYVPSVSEGVVNPYYNAKVWQWADEITAADRGERPFGGWINPRLLRFADIVLLHAEAANELSQSTEALEKLEMVRARARGNNASILPEVKTTNQDELRQAIQHERRIELAMEHERYFDLIRWDLAHSILGPLGWMKGKNEVFPIPQATIDKSEGVIIQNPNY